MEKKKKTSLSLSKRAWRFLRLALLWPRKGGAFKRSILLSLNLSFNTLPAARGAGHHNRLHNFEREFSFDETPSFRFKLHRPRIPCINLEDVDNDAIVFFNGYNIAGDINIKEDNIDEKELEEQCVSTVGGDVDEQVERGIDSKAEDFIAKFYQEMKIQRQVSLIQYNEMLHRSI